MNKNEIIKKASEKGNTTQASMKFYFDLLLETVKEALVKGDTVTITNFGTFQVKDKPGGKQFKNPLTGKSSTYREKKVLKFKSNNNFLN